TFYFKFSEHGTRNTKQISSINNQKSKKTNGQLRIADVKFTGSGCAISIAAASILSENIRHKKISALSKITGEDVLKLIGGKVAPARLKCAFLSLEVIRKVNYEV
ncbi:MAG: hypothetical protein ACD_50C00222G0003, partial [uncultured bacterium]